MKALLFLALMTFFYQLDAQQFGIKAGASYNTMNFAAANSPTTGKGSWKAGFYIGGLLQVPLTSRLVLQPEYLYKLLKGEDKTFKTQYTLHYLSFPVLARVSVNNWIAVLAGPEFGWLIRARETGFTLIDATHNTEERTLSAVGGLEIQAGSGVFVEARYLHGINHVGLRTSAREFKWRGLEVGIGWRFGEYYQNY